MIKFWKTKSDKVAEDQATIVKSAVAGINELVKEINDIVDSKQDGRNGTKRTTG